MVLGLAVLVGAGFASKDRILEEWWIHKLKTGSEEEKKDAAERLGKMRSFRAIPPLVAVMKEAYFEDASAHTGRYVGPESAKYMPFLNALTMIGKPAIPELIRVLEEQAIEGEKGLLFQSVLGSLGIIHGDPIFAFGGMDADPFPLLRALERVEGLTAQTRQAVSRTLLKIEKRRERKPGRG